MNGPAETPVWQRFFLKIYQINNHFFSESLLEFGEISVLILSTNQIPMKKNDRFSSTDVEVYN